MSFIDVTMEKFTEPCIRDTREQDGTFSVKPLNTTL